MKQNILLLALIFLFTNLASAQTSVLAKSYVGHKEAILGIAQSPNGKYLLSGSDDNLAFLWDEDGKIIDTIDVYLKSVNDVVFAPDSKRFITGGSEGDFVIWNIDGTKVATVNADKVYVKTIVYSSDGKYILSGGGDNTAKLWTSEGK
jgi:WD40 repeat protein